MKNIQKPSLPKGTRDFSPEEVAKRTYITKIIQKVFQLYGYAPIETPSFENLTTLKGKYGEEGDRLIFKILNSGNYLLNTNTEDLSSKNSKQLTSQICEKALRYDLTVPFARYVVQHQNDISFPFKRYQIQPVWRADRPQKGRFREFYQCDADAIGSQSLWQEVELIQLYDTVFEKLQLQETTIHINNRKILTGITEIIGESDKLIPFTIALDKLDKIGPEAVFSEMLSKGISETALQKLKPLFKLKGTNEEQLSQLKTLLAESTTGMQGIEELTFIIQHTETLGLKASKLLLNITLARGLDYYTGAIFEVSAPKNVKIGSIGGGGRYDDLTGVFGLQNTSGVGISFGLDRIYLVLESLNLFQNTTSTIPQVMFVNYGETEALHALKAIFNLRKKGISAELYPDASKLKKQLQYASKRGYPNVIFAGPQEIEDNNYLLKEMNTGIQQKYNLEELSSKLSTIKG